MRLLIGRQGRFLDEAREVLRAGLETAAWVTVDGTGARHKACPGAGRGQRTGSVRKSAMMTSPGSAPRDQRAGSTFSNCCAPRDKPVG